MSITFDSVGELLERLGNVSAARVRLVPTPGTATEEDVLAALDLPRKRICELIDGTLVEKAVGYPESLMAAALIELLRVYARTHRPGLVSGEQGLMRLSPSRIRIPDVGYIAQDRLAKGKRPRKRVPSISPNLAIEVLSPANTRKEMLLKRNDYFASGTELYWEFDPKRRTVAVYTRPDKPDVVLGESDTLTGGSVLPGFALSLREFFAEFDD